MSNGQKSLESANFVGRCCSVDDSSDAGVGVDIWVSVLVWLCLSWIQITMAIFSQDRSRFWGG